ncbi:MAG TPA: IS1595 family transposase [Mucilaginibacter sp.]|jgi:transposase|nr:IS1595 family transposase [Mucilaginibacter sp.]
MKYTINEFRRDYPNDDVCLDMIFKLRYAKMPCCPQCSQESNFKRITGRRCYQCADKDCQYQLYPTAGTVFEKTRVSLVDWFYVIYLIGSTRNGVSAKEIQRQLGVTYKCAWRMGHQIRTLMANGGLTEMLSGTVEADETYIGGKNKNMHKSRRDKMNENGTGTINKMPVLTLLERGGRIVTKVVDEGTMKTIIPFVKGNVEAGTRLITDGHGAYRALAGYMSHEVVNHLQDEYVRPGNIHTNTVEGFFSHLKRTIGGTHIHVSKKHLEKYANECSFRYTHRDEGQLMFHRILKQVVQ